MDPAEHGASDGKTQTRWSQVRDRFAKLKATSWPTPAPPPVSEAERLAKAEIEHFKKWEQILAPYKALEEHAQLADHILLLAYRFTRLLAMVTQTISRYGPLAHVPFEPSGWSHPLPKQTHPILIPSGLTLSPKHCDPEVFGQTLMGSLHLFSSHLNSPMHFIAQWLAEELPDRLLIVWPTPQRIVQFERDLVEWVQNMVRLKGRFKAMQKAQDQFDLTAEETAILCNQSLQTYREIGRVDPDIERGLLLARVEDYLCRMRQRSIDPKNELAAMKLHAAITGLTRGVEQAKDEGNLDMVDVIAKVFKEDNGQTQTPKAPPALPGAA